MVARRAHNPKVVGSNPTPATNSGKQMLPFFMPEFQAANLGIRKADFEVCFFRPFISSPYIPSEILFAQDLALTYGVYGKILIQLIADVGDGQHQAGLSVQDAAS